MYHWFSALAVPNTSLDEMYAEIIFPRFLFQPKVGMFPKKLCSYTGAQFWGMRNIQTFG